MHIVSLQIHIITKLMCIKGSKCNMVMIADLIIHNAKNFIIIIINPVLFGFIPLNEGGWIYPTLPAISPTPTLHLALLISF